MLDGRKWTTIARPSQPWVEIAASQTWWEVMGTYIVEGIRHILFGADHLLFVLGLLLIVKDRWMLLKTVTAFTVAHSITLAIATLGYAEAPALPLNAAIALSILFPRAGDRAVVARSDELYDPPSVGGGVCLWPAARFWFRQRADRAPACRAASCHWRCFASMSASKSGSSVSSPSFWRWSVPSDSGISLAALGAGTSRIYRGHARSVLDRAATGVAFGALR